MINSLGTHINGVLQCLEILPEILFHISDAGPKPSDKDFDGFDSKINISAETRQISSDHFNAGKLIPN
jgi:hypothetical protein